MKNIIAVLLLVNVSAFVSAQDFNKNLITARSSYSGGNLEDARFAMQQMLNDLDIAIGKEVLKMLPIKMDAMNANIKSDNVTANTGLAGVLIHRDYGTGNKTMVIDMMGNSPLVGSINAILSIPFVGNSGDGAQKVVKVQGYKGVLQKSENTETNQTDYTLQIPMGSTLITLTAPNSTEADVVRLANTLPMQQMAKMVQ
ncbi:MAG: hypothetical protein ACOYXT_27765 [Bacteroidota bacterium]